MAKSTTETILDAIRVVNGLDRKGRLQVFRYLYKEFQHEPEMPARPGRKKKEKKGEEATI